MYLGSILSPYSCFYSFQDLHHPKIMAPISNISFPQTEKFHQYKPTTAKWYWTLRVTIALFTILGNGLLIVLLMTRRKLRRNLSNRFVFSLNLADLCVGLFVTPPELLCTHWVSCSRETQLAMYEFFVYTSVLCLCVVTWDRYKSVTRPLTYPVVITVRQYVIPIVLCWAVPFVVALLHFTYLLDDREKFASPMKVFTTVETVFFIALPCLALPLAYLHIVCIIRRHKDREKRQQDQVDYNYSSAVLSDHDDALRETEFSASNLSTRAHEPPPTDKLSVCGPDSDIERSTDNGRSVPLKPKQRHPNHDRSITVLGIVIVVFVACWLFAAYLHFEEVGDISHPEPDTTMNLSWLLLLAHSAMNPLVYGFVKRDIKKEVGKCLRCQKY